MRILLVHNYYQMPGGENSVFDNLVRLLKYVGQEVLVYSQDNAEIKKLNATKKCFAFFNSYFSLNVWKEIKNLIRFRKPQVAIVQNVFPLLSPSVYYAIKSEGIPVIQAVYNYRFICSNAHLFTQGKICERCVKGNHWNAVIHRCYRDNRIMSFWYASILQSHQAISSFKKNIDIFMVPDDFMGRLLIKGGIPSNKIRKNVNPFFVQDFEISEQPGDFILYIGRLIRQKGIFTLVDAMSGISSQMPLYIIGDGEERISVEKRISDLGLERYVKVLGPKWNEEVKHLLRGCRFVVVPSEWYDNLPLVICQAFATAKPVVASAINGIPEYVIHEENGLLFQPGNAGELAKNIDYLSYNYPLCRAMGLHARRKAEEELDFEVFWRNLSAIIHDIL